MRKETVITVGVVVVALLLIMLGLFWPSTPERVVESEPVAVEIDRIRTDENAVELPGRAVPESYPDEDDGSRDVTRIVIVDPNGEEITDLLSEKVIINDEVVDHTGQ